jgi:poly(ADP-ribose) glycohydrolase
MWFVEGNRKGDWLEALDWQLRMFQRASEGRFNCTGPDGRSPGIMESHGRYIYIFSDGVLTNVETGRNRYVVEDAWDDRHLRLPCSPSYVFRSSGKKRWDVICSALSKTQYDFQSIRSCILSYSAENGDGWNFGTLEMVLDTMMSSKERANFFRIVYPSIKELAKELPLLFPSPVPILGRNRSSSVSFTQRQCACLLANCFLCTFPRGGLVDEKGLRNINFFRLFDSGDIKHAGSKSAKLLCILQYFSEISSRILNDDPLGRLVVVQRRSLLGAGHGVDWENSQAGFNGLDLAVSYGQTCIEDFDKRGMVWQVDFANKYIGGGVLGNRAVQEEIRFAISPELIVSRIVCPVMSDDETILILGTERFSNYKGYASTFKYDGRHVDSSDVVASEHGMRLATAVICMDALDVSENTEMQFETGKIFRELDKAMCAFLPAEAFSQQSSSMHHLSNMPAVATGNWGCGAFGGDPLLKGMIQLMAAAQASE